MAVNYWMLAGKIALKRKEWGTVRQALGWTRHRRLHQG